MLPDQKVDFGSLRNRLAQFENPPAPAKKPAAAARPAPAKLFPGNHDGFPPAQSASPPLSAAAKRQAQLPNVASLLSKPVPGSLLCPDRVARADLASARRLSAPQQQRQEKRPAKGKRSLSAQCLGQQRCDDNDEPEQSEGNAEEETACVEGGCPEDPIGAGGSEGEAIEEPVRGEPAVERREEVPEAATVSPAAFTGTATSAAPRVAAGLGEDQGSGLGDRPTQNEPKASPDVPKASSDLQETSPDVPKASSDLQETSPDEPKASPDLSKASPDIPKASPEDPQASPDLPNTSPDPPSTSPDEPTAASELPNSSPDLPAASPDRPKPTTDDLARSSDGTASAPPADSGNREAAAAGTDEKSSGAAAADVDEDALLAQIEAMNSKLEEDVRAATPGPYGKVAADQVRTPSSPAAAASESSAVLLKPTPKRWSMASFFSRSGEAAEDAGGAPEFVSRLRHLDESRRALRASLADAAAEDVRLANDLVSTRLALARQRDLNEALGKQCSDLKELIDGRGAAELVDGMISTLERRIAALGKRAEVADGAHEALREELAAAEASLRASEAERAEWERRCEDARREVAAVAARK